MDFKYTSIGYKLTCQCGKEFYVIIQKWGRFEGIEICLSDYKCLNCNK